VHRQTVKQSEDFFSSCADSAAVKQKLADLKTPPEARVNDGRLFQKGLPLFCNSDGKFPSAGLLDVVLRLGEEGGLQGEQEGTTNASLHLLAYVMAVLFHLDVKRMKQNKEDGLILAADHNKEIVPMLPKVINWMASPELCPSECVPSILQLVGALRSGGWLVILRRSCRLHFARQRRGDQRTPANHHVQAACHAAADAHPGSEAQGPKASLQRCR
jgi:hypothetical protein